MVLIVWEYFDGERWIQLFCISRLTFFQIVGSLRDSMHKQNTNWKESINVAAKVACSVYKLAHIVNFITCNEKFAVGKVYCV